MRIERLDRWPETPAAQSALRDVWTRVLADCEQPSVFQTFDWHAAWWESFGCDAELCLLQLFGDDGRPLAIAPLMSVREYRYGLRRRVLMLIGTSNHASDYADFIVVRGRHDAMQAIVDWIAASRNEWNELQLRNLRASSPTLIAFEDCPGLPKPLLQFAAEAPARRFGDAEADRRVANKKSLRRHLNAFAREAPVTLQRLRSADELAEHLPRFFEQHCARWANTSTPSLFHDPAQRRFYTALAERTAASGELHFSAVIWQQRAIAYHFGFERDGVLTWYKPSYDPALERRSPGEVLIKLLVDDALERGLRELDFTVGSEAFKFRFANEVRRVYRLRLQPNAIDRWPALARDALKRRWLAWRGDRRPHAEALGHVDAAEATWKARLPPADGMGEGSTGT